MIENDSECKHFETGYSQLSKKLEIINFKEMAKRLENDKSRNTIPGQISKRKSKVTPLFTKIKTPQNQIELFQKSMKLLLICGQCIGLNPVIGITSHDVSKMRFTIRSFHFWYCCVICACQALLSVLAFLRLVKNSVSISILAFISFYAGTWLTTIFFFRIASKWPAIMKKIANSSLDKYIDISVHTKCFTITLIFLTLSIFEHMLSQNSKLNDAINYANGNTSIYNRLLEFTFPWYRELNIPIHLPIGVLLHLVNVISTINWSYSDLFIVCMSLYLVSILEKINKTINEVDQKFYHPTFWSTVREDYTQATRLVSSFDDVISGIMLASFANNLFFICLQMFYVLAFRDVLENIVYFTFSLLFVMGRFLAVSLAAASVHTASRVTAPALYTVPSTAYCNEVQRFIEQVHGSNVALSGLQFFYVTKELVLAVVGTIVTYELVLLQFNGENTHT